MKINHFMVILELFLSYIYIIRKISKHDLTDESSND